MRGTEPRRGREGSSQKRRLRMRSRCGNGDRRWGMMRRRRRRWSPWVFCFAQLIYQQEALD